MAAESLTRAGELLDALRAKRDAFPACQPVEEREMHLVELTRSNIEYLKRGDEIHEHTAWGPRWWKLVSISRDKFLLSRWEDRLSDDGTYMTREFFYETVKAKKMIKRRMAVKTCRLL